MIFRKKTEILKIWCPIDLTFSYSLSMKLIFEENTNKGVLKECLHNTHEIILKSLITSILAFRGVGDKYFDSSYSFRIDLKSTLIIQKIPRNT
jgi:hypothetical protein